MNATFLGKILIFFNLVLSVFFASWAIGIYTNHIDWPGTGSGAGLAGDKAQGEYTRRKTEIDERGKSAALALARWQGQTATLAALETQRPKNQQWYDARLKAMSDGTDPVASLVFDNAGKLLLQNGKAATGPNGQPLQPRNALLGALAQTEKNIQTEIEQAKSALEEAGRLTQEINGDKEKKNDFPKGLRDLLAEEETAQNNARAELQYLAPFLYNRLAEAELLQKRHKSLNDRVTELERTSKASLR